MRRIANGAIVIVFKKVFLTCNPNDSAEVCGITCGSSLLVMSVAAVGVTAVSMLLGTTSAVTEDQGRAAHNNV